MTETRPQADSDAWARLIDDLWETNPMSRLLPLSPGEVTLAFQHLWQDALKNPSHGWSAYAEFVNQSSRMWTNAALKFWGIAPQAEPAAKPDPADRRFSAPDWQRNAAYDAVKQSYLLSATALLRSAADVEGLDIAEQRKLQFYLRQFVDAISPSNFLFTNPQVIHETIESGG